MSLTNLPQDSVLVLAPRGRDAALIDKVLSQKGFRCVVVPDVSSMLAGMENGASTAIVAEEAFEEMDLDRLRLWLANQQTWSDFPFILLIPKTTVSLTTISEDRLKALGNAILLERPLNAQTLIRATASALRARRRQYQACGVLQMREDSERNLRESQDALRALNETLEQRIQERTRDLAQANDRLMNEITERERIQQSLIQTQKMEAVGHLTGGIAHDFNNLLSVIQGNMDLILMLSTEERTKRMAGIARKAAGRGAKLTGQLLAFSRSQQLDLKSTDMHQVLDGVKELIFSSLGSNIQVSFDLQEDLPLVMADGNQIELAILNLAINARDAMPDGGTLSIRATTRSALKYLPAEEQFVVIAVKDSGTGINPAILDKVFDPFFTTKGVGKGTGLGLSQVYGIAEQSGGTVTISSEIGRGTTVEIWLRFAPTTLESQSADGDRTHQIMAVKRAKILVVEDEPDVRQFMVESLEVLGYMVIQADHGEAGYQYLLREVPDLLITDYLMPGMTGAELVKKAAARFPTLPMIIATGYADSAALEDAIDGKSVLRKPFRIHDLASTVERALSRH